MCDRQTEHVCPSAALHVLISKTIIHRLLIRDAVCWCSLPSAVSLISMRRDGCTPAAIRWKWPPPAPSSCFDYISIIRMPQTSAALLSALIIENRNTFPEAKRAKYFILHYELFSDPGFSLVSAHSRHPFVRFEEGTSTKCSILTACLCRMLFHSNTTHTVKLLKF